MTEADVLHDITKIYKRIEAQNKQTNALYESIKTDKVPHFLESIFAPKQFSVICKIIIHAKIVFQL